MLSDLIHQLQEVHAQHGDLQVFDSGGGMEPVTFVEVQETISEGGAERYGAKYLEIGKTWGIDARE